MALDKIFKIFLSLSPWLDYFVTILEEPLSVFFHCYCIQTNAVSFPFFVECYTKYIFLVIITVLRDSIYFNIYSLISLTTAYY